MPGLEMAPLETHEADEYWKAFVAGRNDLAATNFVVHLERYLRLPPEEQGTYWAFKENGRIVGTVRLGAMDLVDATDALTFFSLLPEARGWASEAVLAAVDPLIAKGATKVHASYDDTYSEAFTKLGFREQFSRIRMEVPLAKRDKPALPMAHPEATDVDDIASFLMTAYEGHFEQTFGMHVGSADDWSEYVTAIWKGESGTYLPLASWLARDGAGIVGVSLVSVWMGLPLLSEIGVRKDQRGKGIARDLLGATMNALVDLGHDRLALYVTVGNDPAKRLYDEMGFRQVGGRTVNAVLEF